MNQPFTLEDVTDLGEIARHQTVDEQARRNSDWLQAHWPDLLPQALGKFLAVAGQEAFLADTPAAAIAWAKAVHPEDQGSLVQFVRPQKGPRLYDHRWSVDALR